MSAVKTPKYFAVLPYLFGDKAKIRKKTCIFSYDQPCDKEIAGKVALK